MKRETVDYALSVGRAEQAGAAMSSGSRGFVGRCEFARGVLAFLRELESSASWWERVVIGMVRGMVQGIVEGCG